MRLEQCEFLFEVMFRVFVSPEILLRWQRDVTTSPSIVACVRLLDRSRKLASVFTIFYFEGCWKAIPKNLDIEIRRKQN